MLLVCGGRWLDVDAVEYSDGDTAFHLTSRQSNNPEILKLLVQSNCHTDCVNRYGMSPLDFLKDSDRTSLFSGEQSPLKLKCLCARLIAKERLNINCLNAVTSKLTKFVVLHGYHPIKRTCSILYSTSL